MLGEWSHGWAGPRGGSVKVSVSPALGHHLESLEKGDVSPCNTAEGLAKEQKFKEAPQGISI